MKKKLMIISVSGLLALGGLTTIGAVAGAGGSLSLTKAASTHADHSDSDGEEHAFYAPGVKDDKGIAYATGNKPYWRCNACCSSSPDSARYDLNDHSKALSLSDVQIPALTKVDSSKVASGDGIANVNTAKFKYVDQGENGVSGKEGTSTPWYVQDEGKTAVYFSASGRTAQDKNCSEFRFTVPEEYKKDCVSVTFSYKYENWGEGAVSGGSMSEPSAFKAMVQFKDITSAEIEGVDSNSYSDYKGLNITGEFENHASEWRSITLKYADAAGKNDQTTNFTDFIIKFADLRGYVMISGLSYKTEEPVTIDKTGSSDVTIGRSAKLTLSSGSATSWSSSDDSVATVDDDGNVTAKKIGSAVITAIGSTNSDTVTINVVAPTSIDGTSLPSSYTASATHTYDVPVVHSGASTSDPYDFIPNSSVTLKDSSGNATETEVPTMKLSPGEISAAGSVYSGFFLKFTIETAGDYCLFSNSGNNPKVCYVYAVSEDGTVGDGKSVFKYDNGSKGVGAYLCQTGSDCHYEQTFEVGTYIFNIAAFGTPTTDTDFGIVKVTATDETATVVTPIVSASGDSATKTISDSYSFSYLQNSAYYLADKDCGVGTIDGVLHAYSKVDDDYIYGDALPIDPSYLDGCFGWDAILTDANLNYISTDIDKHIDSFAIDFNEDLKDETSPIIYFLTGLNIDKGLLDSFNVESDYVNKTVSFSVTFKGETNPVALSIESISELPVTVNSYDVPNKGEAGEDSGVIDEWGE